MSKGRRRGRKEAKMSAIKRHTIKPLAAAVRYARWPLASWASLALLPGAALAGPQGEQVAAGIVNVTRPNAQTTRVQQGSDKEKALAASVPVRRLGESADVARAVTFFADPANSFVTGQVLYVCGGTSVGSLAL